MTTKWYNLKTGDLVDLYTGREWIPATLLYLPATEDELFGVERCDGLRGSGAWGSWTCRRQHLAPRGTHTKPSGYKVSGPTTGNRPTRVPADTDLKDILPLLKPQPIVPRGLWSPTGKLRASAPGLLPHPKPAPNPFVNALWTKHIRSLWSKPK